MGSIQQLQFIEPRKFEWREVAAPVISADCEAIIRPLAVARCDLDLHFASGSYPTKGPFAFGHETAGEVVEVGDGVKTICPGDRVIVPFQISCGDCRMCVQGLTNACETVPRFSSYGLAPSCGKDWGGGFSDLLHVPYADAMLVQIPDSVSLASAAGLSDNITDGYRTVAEALAMKPNGDILIVGGLGQSIGLYAAQFAKALGQGAVDYCDFSETRLAKAREIGVNAIHTDYSKERPEREYDIVLEASTIKAGLRFALHATSPCGVCRSISHPVDGMASIDLWGTYMKGVSWTISRAHARHSLPHALNCVACGQVNPDHITTRMAVFDEAPDILAKDGIKTIFLRT